MSVSDSKFNIDYGKFRESLQRLEEQHEILIQGDSNWSINVQEAMAKSVIRRFRTCYDCLWKLLRRYLIFELGIRSMANSPKPVFRQAAENFVLPSHVEHWLEYANARIDTSHDNHAERTREYLLTVPAFIADAIGIYESMSRAKWK